MLLEKREYYLFTLMARVIIDYSRALVVTLQMELDHERLLIVFVASYFLINFLVIGLIE